ncbi:MAG: NfeD family protein [Christensenellaceae bacterium]|jgi:membrane protein implicated in regulation of membrane protease activity|nr:NfeD family protein [Christensenellaceae bacterium]
MQPWIWAIIIAVLLIVEFTTMGLVSIWFALGAVVGFVLSFFGIPWYWEVVASLGAGFILLASTRKFVVKFLQIKAVNTNADSMVGKETLLLEDVDIDKKGSVRLNGTTWTAAGEKAIAQGVRVRVVKLEGNTVWVEEIIELKTEAKQAEPEKPAEINIKTTKTKKITSG